MIELTRFRIEPPSLSTPPPPPLLTHGQNASHFKRSSASIINLCPQIPFLYDFPCNSAIVELDP